MNSNDAPRQLNLLLGKVRRRILVTTFVGSLAKASLIILPAAALLITWDRGWNSGRASGAIAGFAGLFLVLIAVRQTLRACRGELRTALAVDRAASLKDQVSSSCEFLGTGSLQEAERVQVEHTVATLQQIEVNRLFRWPRLMTALPITILLFGLSFLVPPLNQPSVANIPDPVRQAQLQELAQLRKDILEQPNLPKELEESLKQLEELQRRFERGDIGEREVMLELGRVDETLKSRIDAMGAERLEQQLQALLPHLAANPLTAGAAQALKEQKSEQAAKELNELAEKVAGKKLSHEELKKLATQLGTAAAKLGKKSSPDSLGGDLAKASESLEKSDSEGFKAACRNLGDKCNLVGKCKGLKSACNKIGMCKSGLGQCNSSELGYKLGPKDQSKSKGGLKAGTSASGNPFGDPSKLNDAVKQMVKISGQAGNGPIESETELTEGQKGQSTLAAKDLHAKYAAVAEEVIEREDVPLSHRFHVKRYFQSIRPTE